MLQHLSGLLASGMSVDRALLVLARLPHSRASVQAYQQIFQDLRNGLSLSVAISKAIPGAPRFITPMIKAGEVSGALTPALSSAAEILQRDHSLRMKVQGALLYPAMMIAVAVTAVGVLVTFIVPRFVEVFEGLQVPLPMTTRVLISLARNMPILLSLAGFGLALLGVYRLLILHLPRWRLWWDRSKLSIPIFGYLIELTAYSRMSRSVSLMLGGGVSILESIELGGEVAANAFLRQRLSDTATALTNGETLAGYWSKMGLFEGVLLEMTIIGEETGDLAGALRRAADVIEEELAHRLQWLTTVLEPLLILVIAGMVGLVALSILMPMLSATRFNL